MMRIVAKLVLGVVALGAASVAGYALFGDMSAAPVQQRVPVELHGN